MAEDLELETRQEAEAAGGEARFWQLQLQLAEEDQRDWIKAGEAVVCRYRNEKDATKKSGSRRFAMLYSNTETLKSAIYAKQAKPDVRRRFSDQDPIGKAESRSEHLVVVLDDLRISGEPDVLADVRIIRIRQAGGNLAAAARRRFGAAHHERSVIEIPSRG